MLGVDAEFDPLLLSSDVPDDIILYVSSQVMEWMPRKFYFRAKLTVQFVRS